MVYKRKKSIRLPDGSLLMAVAAKKHITVFKRKGTAPGAGRRKKK